MNDESFFVKSIKSLLNEGARSAWVIKSRFLPVISNGEKADFWTDLGVDDRPLKEAFPRIFAFAVKRSGVVSDFGSWSGSRWQWSVQTRRACFD